MVQLSEDEAQVADRNNVADAGNGTGNEEIADAINESSAIQQNKTGVAGASTGIDTDDHDLRGESTEYGNTQTGDSENSVPVSDSENQEPAGSQGTYLPEAWSTSDGNSPYMDEMRSKGKLAVTVYYQDKDGFLIPVTRWIKMQQGIARAAVSMSIDSAVNREELAYYGLYPVLPEQTRILGIDVRDGIATIDFDRHLLNYESAEAERNIVASIVYTMTEFATIDKVRILVNGYEQGVLKYGTDIAGALGREDIVINTDTDVAANGMSKADIFLLRQVNERFTFIVPVSVADTESAGDMPGFLVRQLLSADTDSRLFNEMPTTTKLLEWNMKDGILTLDFNESFTDYGGNSREEGLIKQLVYTMKQIEGIKRLKILVEGARAQLPEGTDISAGLAIPSVINDVVDR